MAAPVISDEQWQLVHRELDAVLKQARQGDQDLELETSCSLCLALVRLIRAPRPHRVEVLLDVNREHDKCQNHAVILPPHEVTADYKVLLVKSAGHSFVFIHHDSGGRTTKTSPSFGVPWEPLLLKKSQDIQCNIRRSPILPRLIDREWVDIKLLKQWYSTCANFHARTCGNGELEIDQSFPKLLLVDTQNKCLVQMERSCRYIALSYCWGSTNFFLTTTGNMKELFQPQAFEQKHIQLPKTIKQAIALTSALGEQYLWVDALCIVQDGPDKLDQLNAMASLYANSTLTIVAGQGGQADAGFRGLYGISEPRCVEQKIAPLSSNEYLVRPSSKHIWDDSLLHPWSSRAWTFQEAMFPHRILYFANGTVRWCCKTTRWSEESDAADCVSTYAGVEQNQLRTLSPQLEAHKLPVLGEYEALINNYNTRKFTYDEDTLIAFAGVATRLADKFKGGLISGLPEMFFDLCLLWRPLRRTGNASRRRPKRLSNGPVYLPSWSWAGWETEVTWPYTWNFTLDFGGPTPIMLKNNSLPGWKSHSIDDDALQEWGLASDEVTFENLSEQCPIRFCFPVSPSTSVIPARNANLLSFRSMSGHFKLGETRNSIARIHTIDARPAGTLWQHDDSDSDFIRATTGPMESRPSIELIAILGCTTPRESDFMWEMPDISVLADFNTLSALYRTEDVYNVMWIAQDDDGTAFRKGTGVILREIWEQEAVDQCQAWLNGRAYHYVNTWHCYILQVTTSKRCTL